MNTYLSGQLNYIDYLKKLPNFFYLYIFILHQLGKLNFELNI